MAQASQGGVKKTNPHPPFPPSAPTGKGPGMNDRIKGTKPPQAGANSKLPKFSKGSGKGQ
jgi:hypothetical protein